MVNTISTVPAYCLRNKPLVNSPLVGPGPFGLDCQQPVNQNLQCPFRSLADNKINYLPGCLIQPIGQPVFIFLSVNIGPQLIHFEGRLVAGNRRFGNGSGYLPDPI